MDKKFKLEIVILVQFLSCFRPGGCVFGHVSFVVWGHHFRSTFTASRYNYMINIECVKEKEVEGFFGSRIRYYWFALSVFFPLQCPCFLSPKSSVYNFPVYVYKLLAYCCSIHKLALNHLVLNESDYMKDQFALQSVIMVCKLNFILCILFSYTLMYFSNFVLL